MTEPVVFENKVIVASRCQFWTHASLYGQNDIHDPKYDEHKAPIKICSGAILYSNVLVGAGATIGSFARVGANSLVNRDIEPKTFAGGVPAKTISKVNQG